MNDTPEHIRKKQLEIWLSRPPGERLRQFLVYNDAFFAAIDQFKREQAEPQRAQHESAAELKK